MSSAQLFKNRTFDDSDPLFVYSVNGTASWVTNLPDPSLFFNNSLHWVFTDNKLGVGRIGFKFPEAARAAYYYCKRPAPSFNICIDDCSSYQMTVPEELSEDGDNLLYAIKWETPGIHEIILSGSVKDFNVTSGGSRIPQQANFCLDKIDLEVLDNPATTTSSSPTTGLPPSPTSSSQSQTPTPTPASHSSSNVGKIVGGVIGGMAGAILCILIIWLWFRRRHRIQEQTKRERLRPFSPIPQSSQHMDASEMANTAPLVVPRFTTIISNGKRIVRRIVPQIPQDTRMATVPGQFAVDAGPVNDSASSDVGQVMPPQYEQVFGGSAEDRDVPEESPTNGREARRKARR